jgi:hypothetical protein
MEYTKAPVGRNIASRMKTGFADCMITETVPGLVRPLCIGSPLTGIARVTLLFGDSFKRSHSVNIQSYWAAVNSVADCSPQWELYSSLWSFHLRLN